MRQAVPAIQGALTLSLYRLCRDWVPVGTVGWNMSKSLLTPDVLADAERHSPTSPSPQVGGVRKPYFFFPFVWTTNKTWGNLQFGNLVVIVLIALSFREASLTSRKTWQLKARQPENPGQMRKGVWMWELEWFPCCQRDLIHRRPASLPSLGLESPDQVASTWINHTQLQEIYCSFSSACAWPFSLTCLQFRNNLCSSRVVLGFGFSSEKWGMTALVLLRLVGPSVSTGAGNWKEPVVGVGVMSLSGNALWLGQLEAGMGNSGHRPGISPVEHHHGVSFLRPANPCHHSHLRLRFPLSIC